MHFTCWRVPMGYSGCVGLRQGSGRRRQPGSRVVNIVTAAIFVNPPASGRGPKGEDENSLIRYLTPRHKGNLCEDFEHKTLSRPSVWR
jgi:hypothetical protein